MFIDPTNRIRTVMVQEKQFQIYMIPAFEGLRIAKKLAQVALPTVGAFYQGAASESLNFEQIAVTIVEEMDGLEVDKLAGRLLKDMTVDGNAVDFDQYFMSNYGELIEVMTFAIKENFGSFFAAKGLFDKYLPKVATSIPETK